MDFYFKDEWSKLCDGHENFQLLTAFSRDQEDKVYVQHVVKDHQDLVGDMVSNGGAFFYIAGNAKQMPDQVKEALRDSIAKVSEISEAEADEFMKEMVSQKGLQMETWS